jgi:hypothetical protein
MGDFFRGRGDREGEDRMGTNSLSSFYATMLYEMGELIDSAVENMRGVRACSVMNGMGYMHRSRAKK